MKLGAAMAASSLGLAGCMATPPPAPPAPAAPVLAPQQMQVQGLVVANPDAARLLGNLRARSIMLTPSDVSRVDLLAGAPGYAWRGGPDGHLHIHVYRDRQWAFGATRRFIDSVTARSQIIDWVGRPHLFQCGTALALYLGESPQALTVLTNQCGQPAWRR